MYFGVFRCEFIDLVDFLALLNYPSNINCTMNGVTVTPFMVQFMFEQFFSFAFLRENQYRHH